MTDRRNRIHADLMEALQMLKFGFLHGLDFTAGLGRSEEIEELTNWTHHTNKVPEDLHIFVRSFTTHLEDEEVVE